MKRLAVPGRAAITRMRGFVSEIRTVVPPHLLTPVPPPAREPILALVLS